MNERIIDPNKPQATKKDLAAHLGVSIRTIEKWMIDTPPIPHYKKRGSVRFKIAEVEEHFKSKDLTSN